MKAIWMCTNTKDLIEERGKIVGRVHSVFNRACNLITEDNLLIGLISSKIPNSPRSISFNIPENKNIHSLGIEKNMKFAMSEDQIMLGSKSLKIDLSQAKIWSPDPILDFNKLDRECIQRNMECMKDILIDKGNFDGIASIFLSIANELGLCNGDYLEIPGNHYSTFIYSKMLKFISMLLEEDMEGLRTISKNIVGFGPGLTPSTDDFITGIMISMLYAATYLEIETSNIYRLNKYIVEDIEGRTTRVSCEMLTFAAEGQVANHIRSLMVSVFSENDSSKLMQNVCSVIETGETSGTDLIAGAYIGFLLILHSRKGVMD